MDRIELPERPRILVIALRRLGDVLLTTPLIRSLRRAWPDAAIDALVFADTAGILEGNPDLNAVVAMAARPTSLQSAALARRLWRRYDLAVSTQPGDRPTFFAFAAGRVRVGPIDQDFNGRLKRMMYTRSLPRADGLHRVEENLRLCDLIGIDRRPKVLCPASRTAVQTPDGDYAVIHAAPMFRYKQWTTNGWRELAKALAGRGLTVIATGGPAEQERRYLDEVWSGLQVQRCDGTLSWPQLSALLAKARVYVGPDTSVTHLAAAAGCPTVALYGPTDPRLWGPWPAGGLDTMWADTARIQNRGNVWLVQHAFPCTPCQLEGCERKLESYSACLDELSPAQVIEAVDAALNG
ncbi:MAG TPA: glycosyltransferase family 9 protein [Pseudolabrys sp.]|nr:glycosyltransferase family 9 protein [Pseudolabrys sp.]